MMEKEENIVVVVDINAVYQYDSHVLKLYKETYPDLPSISFDSLTSYEIATSFEQQLGKKAR
jgi:hypothetical protein